ncbi:hypothetical protein B0J13DRAFT_558726 [Dactylonectria estremocensis]|uniref:NACHT domain-containing protein n=1 Tax=Dactylonectria estremocensis TaxID=1079267 RepID=A0A9P9EMY3_9HYPO|nr:hypothetical protein B0J13DRAFT_558726 [Dactylonectria estremocensis]
MNVEKIQKSLDGYTQVMETQLMLNLCTMADAVELKQSQGFQNLTDEVRALVSQIANGSTKIEDLIQTEHNTTRDLVTVEAEKTRENVKAHLGSELQALGVRAATNAQRERLLRSLKADVMNQRYNNVMDSNAATFERVFRSYEHASHQDPNNFYETDSMSDEMDSISDEMIEEIDQEWTGFISWLQSDNRNIFWIRGKPGSGKSTLMKFVIDNDTTKQLLNRWRPGTKVLAHFFWKIGSAPQNTIKGLLCSLLHCILRESSRAIDWVLHRFKSLPLIDSYHDWSDTELEKVLSFLLDEDEDPVCIFIDGLDEISDQDGYFKLLNLVEKLNTWDQVKACVSGRPETQLVQRFQTIGATSIRLEDLTRPEMKVHVHKQLRQFNANGQISSSLLEKLTYLLLNKAQGVFLWLFLATRSLVKGIQSSDDEKTLLRRLEQLPRELKDLYADMWRRLNGENSVYRETAARYLRYAVTDKRGMRVLTKENSSFLMVRPTLLEVTLAERASHGECLTPKANDSSLTDLKLLCETTAKNIPTRCAGLLQLSEGAFAANKAKAIPSLDDIRIFTQEMKFIHRTAHDFLMETEAGQDILKHKHVPSLSVHTDVTLVKSMLCVASILHKESNLVAEVHQVTTAIAETARKGGVDKSDITTMLSIGLELWQDGVISPHRNMWKPSQQFLSILVAEYSLFDDFVLSILGQADSSSTIITDTLRDICAMAAAGREPVASRPPIKMMQKLMSMGADPHAIGMWKFQEYGFNHRLSRYTHTHQVTAYGLFLTFAFNHLRLETPDVPGVVDVIDTMTQTCPNWQTRILLHVHVVNHESPNKLRPWSWFNLWFEGAFFLDVDLQFLLVQFLAAIDSINLPPHESSLHNVAKTLAEPVAILRFLTTTKDEGCRSYYRILNQQPFQDSIGALFDSTSHHNDLDDALSLVNDPALAKKVDIVAELDMLVEEVQGFVKIFDDETPPRVSFKDTE